MIETNKKLNLLNDTSYQSGSIISTVISKKSSGNVTFFAFDKDETLSPHSAPFDAIVHVVDGKAEIMIGDDFHILSAGELIVMPANIVHAVKAIEQFKMVLVMLKS